MSCARDPLGIVASVASVATGESTDRQPATKSSRRSRQVAALWHDRYWLLLCLPTVTVFCQHTQLHADSRDVTAAADTNDTENASARSPAQPSHCLQDALGPRQITAPRQLGPVRRQGRRPCRWPVVPTVVCRRHVVSRRQCELFKSRPTRASRGSGDITCAPSTRRGR